MLEGYGWRPINVTVGFDGEPAEDVHPRFAAALDDALDDIAAIQSAARGSGNGHGRPAWPMLVLRSPKGWTGPRELDGLPVENSWRSHQVPIADPRDNEDHLQALEDWMRSYRPEELFDERGTLRPDLAALSPSGTRRMSAIPQANGGELLRDLSIPDFRGYAVDVPAPGKRTSEAMRVLGGLHPRRHGAERATGSGCSAPTRPPRTGSERCSRCQTGSGRPRSSTPTTTWPPRAASWRCCRSTSARAGSRATSSPGGTASSTATRRSSTSSTRW